MRCARFDRFLDRLTCAVFGHEPSWVIAVACAPNAEPPSRPVCVRCRQSVED